MSVRTICTTAPTTGSPEPCFLTSPSIRPTCAEALTAVRASSAPAAKAGRRFLIRIMSSVGYLKILSLLSVNDLDACAAWISGSVRKRNVKGADENQAQSTLLLNQRDGEYQSAPILP